MGSGSGLLGFETQLRYPSVVHNLGDPKFILKQMD